MGGETETVCLGGGNRPVIDENQIYPFGAAPNRNRLVSMDAMSERLSFYAKKYRYSQ